MNNKYFSVKDLPETIQRALRSVGFNRKDITVDAREKMMLSSSPCFDGNRGFTAIVDIATGHMKVSEGSWGGSNMFVKTAVDDDQNEYEIPSGVCVIKGENGGKGCFAHLYFHPTNLVPFLPEKDQLSDRQKNILKIFGYKSNYRKEYLERSDIRKEEIDELISLGYIEKKGPGLGLSTKGKNSR